MDNEDIEIREAIETHFSENFCRDVERAVRYRFPNIKNLSVDMDTEGIVHIFFEETEYPQKEVQDFINEFRKSGHKANAAERSTFPDYFDEQ